MNIMWIWILLVIIILVLITGTMNSDYEGYRSITGNVFSEPVRDDGLHYDPNSYDTQYHQECIDGGYLLTDDYNDFDMSKLIVKTPIPHDRYYAAVREMYSIAFSPKFVIRQIMFLFNMRKKDWQFIFIYGLRAVRRVRQHIFNLTRNEKK